MKSASKIALNNDISMAVFGHGVWKIAEGEETEQAVLTALEAGYRLIDTATYYRNEASVGMAVRNFITAGKARREDIFVTTKLWPADFIYPEKTFHKSLGRLGLEYIDLYLIHWPAPIMPKNIWQTLEKMYEQKLAHAIG